MAFLIKLLLIVLQRVDPNILLTFCMNKGSDFIYDPVFALFEKKNILSPWKAENTFKFC